MPGTDRKRRGVLVAGGQGKRLGLLTPKALVRLGSSTLYERALRVLLAATQEVDVAAPTEVELPVDGWRARRVFDRPEGRGPLAGVTASLGDGNYSVAAVFGVDYPFMSVLFLMGMVRVLADHPEMRAIVPVSDGRLQPLAAAYTREAGDALVQAFEAGERSITRAVERLGPVRWEEARIPDELGLGELPIQGCFFNLNTPEDLAEAERRVTP